MYRFWTLGSITPLTVIMCGANLGQGSLAASSYNRPGIPITLKGGYDSGFGSKARPVLYADRPADNKGGKHDRRGKPCSGAPCN